jgi:hypothetical protein
MPRSGTKLLRGLLNQSPGIRVLDVETNFFPFFVRWVGEHGEPHDAEQFERLHAALSTAPYFAHRQGEPFSWRTWRAWCERCDAGGLFEGFVRCETGLRREDPVMWGDKSPAYIRHMELLLEHFPNARIVHIVRDVRDYCVSIRKAWRKDVRRAAHLWARDVAVAHRICMQHPQRCIEVRYEELLQSPEAQMRRLCAFLDLQYCDAMMRLHRRAEPRRESSSDAPAAATEIVRNNFGKFTQQLTARDIRAIEALAFDTMRALGWQPLYARRRRNMSRMEEGLRRLKDGVHLVCRGKGALGLGGALRFHLSHGRLAH